MNFTCIKAFRTIPKSMLECIFKHALSVTCPNTPWEAFKYILQSQKWSEITFFTPMQIVRNLGKNSIFEVILRPSHISWNFNGRFRTKECSKRKVSGDLFGPKCDGDYISDLFETYRVDLEWSEMLYQYQEICHGFCKISFILWFLWILHA